jgi:hypothetical protein
MGSINPASAERRALSIDSGLAAPATAVARGREVCAFFNSSGGHTNGFWLSMLVVAKGIEEDSEMQSS